MPELSSWFVRHFRRRPRHALVGRSDLWEMKRAFQIDFLCAHGLQAHERVLDIGCGSLRGGIALIRYLEAGAYTGVDVRPEVLDEAREELARERLASKQPTIILAMDGLAALRFGHRFDVLWAFSVLFHLSDAIVPACFQLAQRYLEPDGVFYANVIVGAGEPGRWQGFPVVPRSLDTYRMLADSHGLGMERMGTLAELGHHSGDPSQDSQTMLAFRRTASSAAERVPV